MSDFFGSLTGGNIRFTDARINGDGPLPTSLSGPEVINGDPDGRYNFNDSLLSGIVPYAYGQGRMGSDRNYQQIPIDRPFIVLTETKFSKRHIPVWETESSFQCRHFGCPNLTAIQIPCCKYHILSIWAILHL
jgi:hypothetical protein